MGRLNPRQLVAVAITALLGLFTIVAFALGLPLGALIGIVLIAVVCAVLLVDIRRRGQDTNELIRQLAAENRETRQQLGLLSDQRGADDDERWKELRTRLSEIRYEPVAEVSALLTLHQRFEPRAGFDSHAASAMAPSVVARLADIIARERPRLVVECGSGISSVWMGYALAEAGCGRLVSLEHHPTFLNRTRGMIAAHGLEDVVEVRHAPIVAVEIDDMIYRWYQIDASTLSEIGLLLVDGPPAATGALARYPAIPVLGDRLLPGALIALDDASRPDEQAVLERWVDERTDLELTHEFADRTASLRVRR